MKILKKQIQTPWTGLSLHGLRINHRTIDIHSPPVRTVKSSHGTIRYRATDETETIIKKF
jgi:hypothetical protein